MSKFHKSAVWAAAVMATALVGCATPEPAPAPAPVPVDPIANRLAEAIVRVNNLPEFTRNADLKAPAADLQGPTVTASFQGDATTLLRKLAAARGVAMKVTGPKPHLPLIVHVHVADQPYEEFLKDVALQFGQRAHLVLSDEGLEIRHRGQPQQ